MEETENEKNNEQLNLGSEQSQENSVENLNNLDEKKYSQDFQNFEENKDQQQLGEDMINKSAE